jgi:hypothetical protein
MIVAGVVAVVAVIAVAVSALGGSGGSPAASTQASTGTTATGAKHPSHKHTSTKPAVPANAAETPVAVINATETPNLAHRISGQLQQLGYSQASALAGTPPGTGQTTVVEYSAGHQSDAEGVAHAIGVSQVQPMESAVAALAGSANVAVVVGADKASP